MTACQTASLTPVCAVQSTTEPKILSCSTKSYYSKATWRLQGGRKIKFAQIAKTGLTFLAKQIIIQELHAGVLELADETDSKSVGGDTVWVRPPPPAYKKASPGVSCLRAFFCIAVVRGRTGRRAAARNQQSSGLLVSPRETQPAGKVTGKGPEASHSRGKGSNRAQCINPPFGWHTATQRRDFSCPCSKNYCCCSPL